MKKITLYSLLLILICFAIAIGVGITAGKTGFKKFVEAIVEPLGQYVDVTADIKELNGSKISEYSELEIKASRSKIRILASEDEFLHVESAGNKSNILVAVTHGKVILYNLKDYLNYLDGHFVLQILSHENIINLSRLDNFPTTFRVPKSIKMISIKTESGDIKFDSVSFESAKIYSISGQVELHRSTVENLNTNLISGYLETEGLIKSGEIKSVSGNIKITNENSSPNLKVTSISGDIKLYFSSEPDVKLEFESVGGLLRLAVGPRASKIGQASETEDFRTKKIISLGHGSGQLNLSTVSGSVLIHQIKQATDEK